ncbi:MAG: T9SS type A sorting domain-containing protein [Bacteroidetes bacterium]|nr:T9SS type A sorting domain-containing protein [Bacteroidota bacterium]
MKNYTIALLLMMVFCSAKTFSLPTLSSYPSATATIYLDFDGQTVVSAAWNGGSPLVCAAAPLNDAQITEIFNRVSEDYRPFNVNITTSEAVYLAAPPAQRMRIIITPTSAWRPGVGGISYIGSFTWGDDTPGFVFTDRLGPNNTKYIAECCTHESGHTVGLSHQSSYDQGCNLTETYNSGTGTGEIGWAPVMGNSYYRNMTGWNDGPTPYGCANTQDNLTIITSQNGFSYRADDFAETMDNNTFSLSSNGMVVDGLISTNTDKDAFKFTVTATGNFHLNAVPYSVNSGTNDGADLDIKISMYDATGTLVKTYDPTNTMSVTIDTVLNSGTYYLIVDGTGNQNTSNYGSLGSYKLTGITGSLPIHSVTLSGYVFKQTHNLSWNIVTTDAIKSQEIEFSEDGTDFKSLTTITPPTSTFTYAPSNANILYYRVKITSVLNQVVYSNIISLRTMTRATWFTVSTLVNSRISVTADDNYQYRLLDANGRLIATGTGIKGFNSINIDNRSAGLYIIQLFSTNHRQTERIIKQ